MICSVFANYLSTSFTATSKRDIMFSEKLNMMCATKGFCNVKARFYKALSHQHVSMMGLIGAGNNPMVGMTAPVAVAIEEAGK